MARYRYDGLDPEVAPDGSGLVRPLDGREFDAAPAWGAWTPLDEPETPPDEAPPPPAPGPETPAAATTGTEG